ncbi:hypothetical protein GCM10010218_52060 [Streptomyces mashuensis]|uniref:Uncharacterized protein n=1 Tax=Streptomyces mashuensis TaxID=33904 RepID=A0A919B8V2_9ACTN|nr:hypothetical protein [Streptomyces mashuensis]GHF64174.1 hypothetical protein GCM10010218_52060 [Streptomyces mashuensis]
MVQAKPEMRDRARELRRAGKTYDEIVAELGVAKSSVSLWVRDLPKPRKTVKQMREMSEARWAPYREARDAKREEVKRAATAEIGAMTDRDLFIAGVALYWAEGTKSKPHRPSERATFINSDPDVIYLYLRWLALLGVKPERLRFHVMVHENANVAAVEQFWADLVGVDITGLGKTTLKKHNPKTVRKNVGEHYRGCLIVRVLDSADLYRRIEGWWYGIVSSARATDHHNRT